MSRSTLDTVGINQHISNPWRCEHQNWWKPSILSCIIYLIQLLFVCKDFHHLLKNINKSLENPISHSKQFGLWWLWINHKSPSHNSMKLIKSRWFRSIMCTFFWELKWAINLIRANINPISLEVSRSVTSWAKSISKSTLGLAQILTVRFLSDIYNNRYGGGGRLMGWIKHFLASLI